MFSSTDDPFESLFKRSFTYDQNPSSGIDDPPYFMDNYPSPFLANHDLPLNQILSQNQPTEGTNTINHEEDEGATCNFNENYADQTHLVAVTPTKKKNPGPTPRKRTGKKDRHSKICTAQGIRDRRMRLSVQVARKFFDLQDMLGYDKASKTIDWLFAKSKKAIKELAKSQPDQAKISSSIDDQKSGSIVSECEVVLENSNNQSKRVSMKIMSSQDEINCVRKIGRKPSTRESRDKARARAREKALIKRIENLSQWQKSSPNEFQELGFSSSTFDGVEKTSSNDRKRDSQYDVDCNFFGNQFGDEDTIEKLLGTTTTLKACPISDYQSCYNGAIASGFVNSDNNFMGFLEDYDTNNDMFDSNNSEMENMVSFAGNPTSYFNSDFIYFNNKEDM